MSEAHFAYVEPVPEFFKATLDRGAMFDLIVTLRASVRDLENLPESIPAILADLEAVYAGDLPEGIDADAVSA